MNYFNWISIIALCFSSACTLQKQTECDRLKKEALVIPSSVEEMLDTTKSVYRLKNCEMDIWDVEMLRPYFAALAVSGVRDKKEYTYGDVFNYYESIKNKNEYKEEKEAFIKQRQAQLNASEAPKTILDYSKLCDTPLYAENYPILKGIQQYYDYEQALKCARQQHKILIVHFNGHSCVNCRKLERIILSDEGIQSIIAEKCIMVSLYCDEKEIEKNGKTIGEINLDFEMKRFGQDSQPLVVFLNNKEEVLGKTGFGNKESFLKILSTAVSSNN